MERAAFKQFATLERTHWWFAGRRRLYLPLLADVLSRDRGAPPADLSVMDVGCGVGGFLGPLSDFGRVVGLEMDEPSIGWCRERGYPATAVALSETLPVRPASQDLICLWDVIEHTPDDRPVLEEMCRTLKPGAHLAISVPAYPFLFANNDRVAHHYRRYTRGGLVRRVEAAGLEVRKATYVNVWLAPLIIPAVLLLKLQERLLPLADDQASNISRRVPRPLNALLAWIFSSER
ncbi:MAG: class I SAM-dependent methyltransferase, partial [Planctomycetota bacterium]